MIRPYRVRLDGGDGYCPFFASVQVMERVEESWFPGHLGEWGRALLFRVVEGSHRGEYIAITNAMDDSFLLENGYFPGVAHHILKPGEGFSIELADPCGKAAIFLIKDGPC